MNLREENKADSRMIVGSLEVLQGLSGPAIKEIKKNVADLSNSVSSVVERVNDYWSEIAGDNVINPSEKKELKREWNVIEQTYTSLMQSARDGGKDEEPEILSYKEAYANLREYLFVTLDVFSKMQEKTIVEDPAYFNSVYKKYYDAQLLAEKIIYQSKNGEYKGPLDYIPEVGLGDYFLAKDNFIIEGPLATSEGNLLVNGLKLQVKISFSKGIIYVYTIYGWRPVLNKNNWRYIIATNDLVDISEPVSDNLSQTIRAQSGLLYLGPLSEIPENPSDGQYFVFSGISEGYVKGIIYKYKNNTWQALGVNDPANYSYYMTALLDILDINKEEVRPGYFTTIFANALMANQAVISQLQTQIITLQQGGKIKSWNYGETEGFLLDGDTGLIKSVNGEFVNAKISGDFQSQKGYKFNNSISWTSGSIMPEEDIDLLSLKDTLLEYFPDGINGSLFVKGRMNIICKSKRSGIQHSITLSFNSIQFTNSSFRINDCMSYDNFYNGLLTAYLTIFFNQDSYSLQESYGDQDIRVTDVGIFTLSLQY